MNGKDNISRIFNKWSGKQVTSLIILILIVLAIVLSNIFFIMLWTLLGTSYRLIMYIYQANTLYFPMCALVAVSLLLITYRKSLRQCIPKVFIIFTIGYVVFCFLVRIYATHIEPERLVVRKVMFRTSKINSELRILHISDIQSAGIGRYEQDAFRKIKNLKPDLIIHTGDMLQPIKPATIQSEIPKLRALFETLNPPLGLLGVLGNIDYPLRFTLTQNFGGLEILNSDIKRIDTSAISLSILGLSFPESVNYRDPMESVRKWLEHVHPNDFTILLGHSPYFINRVSKLPIDLCLAGHTHGGQIWLPGFGPLIRFKYIPRSLMRGYHHVGKTHVNVSAGIGCEHAENLPSIRIFCPSEMTMITLKT